MSGSPLPPIAVSPASLDEVDDDDDDDDNNDNDEDDKCTYLLTTVRLICLAHDREHRRERRGDIDRDADSR
jgi:hypothetical protein